MSDEDNAADNPAGPGVGAADAAWNEQARGETPLERLDRNWTDLLQELRVVQTGVQFLTGFLLTLPFQARFASLTTAQQNLYLATVAVSVAATGFLIAPVSLHRVLFRRHERRVTVAVAHRLALIGVTLLGLAIVGVVWLIFDVVRGRAYGLAFGAGTAVVLLLLWVALPWSLRTRAER
ncbi:hypothetical protein SAMN05892883_1619 [Jatrophihabitans sp. GAS493]|uniref:DUF6328 family protein n=1 Tax=Jatrophihabitans sp. GAS493 TaxID=1907575 RepID=UPI000BBFFFA0|nr:DUF6328 family protein [Jatrophihabitans sp. GAS493]SOD72199.1 hypothetical protein SAMN05892883_1619 [Jatrophihabitans sp. GAS493]